MLVIFPLDIIKSIVKNRNVAQVSRALLKMPMASNSSSSP